MSIFVLSASKWYLAGIVVPGAWRLVPCSWGFKALSIWADANTDVLAQLARFHPFSYMGAFCYGLLKPASPRTSVISPSRYASIVRTVIPTYTAILSYQQRVNVTSITAISIRQI